MKAIGLHARLEANTGALKIDKEGAALVFGKMRTGYV